MIHCTSKIILYLCFFFPHLTPLQIYFSTPLIVLWNAWINYTLFTDHGFVSVVHMVSRAPPAMTSEHRAKNNPRVLPDISPKWYPTTMDYRTPQISKTAKGSILGNSTLVCLFMFLFSGRYCFTTIKIEFTYWATLCFIVAVIPFTTSFFPTHKPSEMLTLYMTELC